MSPFSGRGPSLLLLPVAVAVGTVIGLATLGDHQDAVRPTSSPAAAHSKHVDGVHPTMKYFDSLARRVHL